MSGHQFEVVYLTFEEMLEDLIRENGELGSEERDMLKMYYDEGTLIRLHLHFGMSIRNHYSLWHEENPINKQWHTEGAAPDSDYHPDSVSMRLIEQMCERLFGPREIKPPRPMRPMRIWPVS